MADPQISVIIPTANRPGSLQRTLSGLSAQSLNRNNYPFYLEVIIVDNSTSEPLQTDLVNSETISFKTLRHPGRGPTQARNFGAQSSCGDVLVFLDDDIYLRPDALLRLVKHCQDSERQITLGSLTLPQEILDKSLFAQALDEPIPTTDRIIDFTFCKTGLLALPRKDFFRLGMFNDPTGGWPNWDDVDFGYRAYRQGYSFIQCAEAVGEHWDYASLSLQPASQRIFRAARSAVRLFQVYPELATRLPMFNDMLPIHWTIDGFRLSVRKVSRRIMATPASVKLLEGLVQHFEKNHAPISRLLRLYTWVMGAYIYQGFQAGLRQYGQLPQTVFIPQ